MSTLGDIPVPVMLTREQVRLIRGMVATTAVAGRLLPDFQKVKDVLDRAEDSATIHHAGGWTPVIGWEGD